MSNVRRIHFRVNETQYKRLKNLAQAKQYLTISSYIRNVSLKDELFLEIKILENNKLLKEILDLLKTKSQPI